ncbi:MAG TPA: hypothetical protein VGC06_26690 [Actinomycetes bacterium]
MGLRLLRDLVDAAGGTLDDIQLVGEATGGDEAIGVASDTDPRWS